VILKKQVHFDKYFSTTLVWRKTKVQNYSGD